MFINRPNFNQVLKMNYTYFIKEKLAIPRNLYFFLAFIILSIGIAFMLKEDGANQSNLNSTFGIYCLFYYVYMLVLLAGEKGSGFLAKQLTNGLSRKSAYVYFQIQILFLSILYYFLFLLTYFIFAQIESFGLEMLKPYLFSFISFWCLAQLAFFIILFFRKAMNAVLTAYLVIHGLDGVAFKLLLKHSKKDLHFMFPHGLAENLPIFYGTTAYNVGLLILCCFIVIVGSAAYFKLLKSNLI